ncbi:MAG: pilin [Patescibacteria group bacterium]
MKNLNLTRFGLAILTASLLFFTTVTLAVSAQSNLGDYGLKDTATAAGLPTGAVGPIDIAATIINLLLGVIGVVAVLIIIYGGFTWMTAAGNEEKITKARKLLAGAIIGLFIILASYALASFAINQIKQATLSNSSSNQTSAGCYDGAPCGPDNNDILCCQGYTCTEDAGSWVCKTGVGCGALLQACGPSANGRECCNGRCAEDSPGNWLCASQ